MATLTFPPSDQSPFEGPNGVTYIWNGNGYWEASVDDAYLSKLNDDRAEGKITFEDVTTHNLGIKISNLTSISSLGTDAQGNIIPGTSPDAGDGGAVNQNLGYVTDGNNDGVVTITDGTDATIPVATNSVAGLFTGTEKQKLAGIAASAGVNQDLGYTKNSNSAGTVTITNGTNATIPIVTNTVAGLMTGTQKQTLDGLRTNSQNDARYLRVDSGSGNQTRLNGVTGFSKRIVVGDGSQIATVVSGSERAYIYCSASQSTRWGAIGLPGTSKLYGSIPASNGFGGAADAQAAAFFAATDNVQNSKELIGLYSRSGSSTAKCGIIEVNHNLKEPRHVTDNTYGFGFGCKSTSGGNQAACITLYGRTGSTYHRAGYIKAGGEGNGAYVRITSTNGSAPATTFETDTRNVTSVTPLPSAVNLVKALNPSLIELNNGNTVVSFPFNATKLTTAYAAIGSETEEDEGEPQFAGVDHGRLVPVLTKALQEALDRIETLEADVATLQGN